MVSEYYFGTKGYLEIGMFAATNNGYFVICIILRYFKRLVLNHIRKGEGVYYHVSPKNRTYSELIASFYLVSLVLN